MMRRNPKGDGNVEESVIANAKRKATISRKTALRTGTLMMKAETWRMRGQEPHPHPTRSVRATEVVETGISTRTESETGRAIESISLLHISTVLATVTVMIDLEAGTEIASIDIAIAVEALKTLKTDRTRPIDLSRPLQPNQKLPLADHQLLPMARSK
jgi:hypothetical protein